jgi:hypothetical protein
METHGHYCSHFKHNSFNIYRIVEYLEQESWKYFCEVEITIRLNITFFGVII